MARIKTDSNLVIEQRGSRVVLAGLLVSILIGLTIKAIFSPSRIQYEVERLIELSQTQGKVEITGAQLSFARGWLPQLAIVVTGIHMQSVDLCLGQPEIQIERIQFPVSFLSLWQRKIVLQNLEIENFSFHSHTSHQCEKDRLNFNTPVVKTDPKPLGQVGKETPIVQTVSLEAPALSSIRINEMRFSSALRPGVKLFFQDVEVDLTQSTKLTALIESKVLLSHESIPNERDIKGDLVLTYEADRLSGELQGTWREGFYRLEMQVERREAGLSITADGELRHIPLSQILPLLTYYRVSEKQFSGKQSWLSAHVKVKKGFHEGSDKELDQYDLSQIKFEGEFGEIKAPLVRVNSTAPWHVEPFTVEINQVYIDQLLQSFNLRNPWDFSAGLGVLGGSFAFRDAQHFSFLGKIQDAKFIFSNKGRRDIQVLDTMDVSLSQNEDKLNIIVNNLALKEGFFDGSWNMEFVNFPEQVKVNAKIDKLLLSPPVQNLMTSGGELGDLSGLLELQLHGSKIERLLGHLSLNKSVIEKVNFEQVSMDLIKDLDQPFHAKFKISQFDFKNQMGLQEFLKPLNSVEFNSFDRMQGELQWEKSSSVLWKNLEAYQKSQKLELNSFGQWSQDGKVDGQLVWQENNLQKHFKVLGTRKQPRLENVEVSHE